MNTDKLNRIIDEQNDTFKSVKSILKFIIIFLGIPFILILTICYSIFQSINIDDANIRCSVNSKEAWEYFVNWVSTDTTNVLNVRSEDHSNIRQRDYKITFVTDSIRLFKIILNHSLHRAEEKNLWWKSTERTITCLRFIKNNDEYTVDFSIEDAGGVRDFACDDINQRCIYKIEDTIAATIKSCYKECKPKILKDSTVNNYLYITVTPEGIVTNIDIEDKFNRLPGEFKMDIIDKVSKIRFGKIITNDTVSLCVPIIWKNTLI